MANGLFNMFPSNDLNAYRNNRMNQMQPPTNFNYSYPYGQVQPQQPIQNQPQMPMLKGRVVNEETEIAPQEIGMDGTVSFFPKSDYSCIFAKVWNNDGTISTFKFVPEAQKEEVAENSEEPVSNGEINKKLDDILAYLKKPRKPYNNHKNYNKENGDESKRHGAQNA